MEKVLKLPKMEKMIYIDDSGIGSIFGGASIGMFRDSTISDKKWEVFIEVVPLMYFQGSNFKNGIYKDETLKIIKHGLRTICSSGIREKIIICSSPILIGVREFMKMKKIKFTTGKVTGFPQRFLESFNAHYLKKIGVPIIDLTKGHGGLSFRDSVSLIKKNPKLIYLAKTGWEALEKWNDKQLKMCRKNPKLYIKERKCKSITSCLIKDEQSKSNH